MSPLEPEAGIWYALVWTVVIFRLISRRMHLGSWKHLQLDDYLILVAMATDTVLVACMHIVVNSSSNLIPPGDDVSKYTPEEIQSRIYGSKLVLVVEQMQLSTTWLIKACLLTLYSRITGMLSQHKLVIATAYYVGFSFVCTKKTCSILKANHIQRLSWKFSTLAFGAGPSTNTGLFQPTRVCHVLLLSHETS